jgi:hypothetical protein
MKRKTSIFAAAIALLCCTQSCELLRSFTIALTGAYETGDADQSPAGASVTVGRLDDTGDTEPVSGELGTGKTDEQGVFHFWFFEDLTNLIIAITQKGETTKCTLIDVQEPEQEISLKTARFSAAAAQDDKNRFAIVSPETDISTALLLQEVKNVGTKPAEVNLYDIDELLDAGIAAAIRPSDGDQRSCILAHIHSARHSSRMLLLDILAGKTVSEDSVADALDKFKSALPKIEQLRKAIRRQLYTLKKSGADPSAVQELLDYQRQQVFALLSDAKIPPQLYMKASRIAQDEFERALKNLAADCDIPPILLYRLTQRTLTREVQENAVQTKGLLVNLFNYGDAKAIDTALQEALGNIAKLAQGGDNREDIKAILGVFYSKLRAAINAAVPEAVAADTAIKAVYAAMIARQPDLRSALNDAQNASAVKAAYAAYYASLRDTIITQFGILSTSADELQLKKKALADLLFVLRL